MSKVKDQGQTVASAKARVWPIIGGVLSVLGLCLGVYHLARVLRGLFSGLQKEVAASLITAVATVAVAVISIRLSKLYEQRKAIEEEIRQKKIPEYEKFIEFLLRVVNSTRNRTQPISEKEMNKFLIEFTQKMLIWGSDDVIKRWSEWRRLSMDADNGTLTPSKLLLGMEDILFAIRKDIGYRSTKLQQGDLLALFVNDIHKYLPPKS